MYRNFNNYEIKGRRIKTTRFSLYDVISIIVYILLIVFIAYKGVYKSSSESTGKWLIAYSFGTPLFLYIVNYKSLRNIRIYLIWITISIFHLVLYNKLQGFESLSTHGGHSANGLQYTIVYLILWQLLRVIYYKITKMELVAPMRGSYYDYFDCRKLSILDYTAFIIYMGVFIFLTVNCI